MGVAFKRVQVDAPPVTETTATATGEANADGTAAVAADSVSAEPPGLFDKNDKPDEPGAEYWMHGELSPNPIQSKMGVRVERRKK